MRVFVAGASGVIGRRLIPLLAQDGHAVTGMTRSESKAAGIRSAGADAVVADALDPAAVAIAVTRAKPEVIVHELTAIPAAFEGGRGAVCVWSINIAVISPLKTVCPVSIQYATQPSE